MVALIQANTFYYNHYMTSWFISVIQSWKKHYKSNIWSGITVALISLPLSIALALASGATPEQGIITGIWATLFAALFGGSPVNVIGVAGALSSIVFGFVATFPGVSPVVLTSILAIASGFVIAIIYALKLDTYLRYVPASVMTGFASGVAILIASGQLFDALGLAIKKTGHFLPNMKLLLENISTTNIHTLVMFVLIFAGMMIWRSRIKKLPAVIPASVLGIIIGVISGSMPHWGITRLVDKFGNISLNLAILPDIDSIQQAFTTPGFYSILGTTALLVACISVLETLITARIGDRMTKLVTDTRQELFGLSLSNIVSGLMGGLPSTGVFIRTGANIKAGANHRSSQAIAAIVTLLFAFVCMPLFKFIPLAVIAAMLFVTAVGLLEIHAYKSFWKDDRIQFWLAALVCVITVVQDAGIAILVGVVAGLFVFVHSISHEMITVWYNSHGKITKIQNGKQIIQEKNPPADIAVMSIAGFINYLDIEHIITVLKKIQIESQPNTIIVRMRDVYHIDTECVAELSSCLKELEESGVVIELTSLHGSVKHRILHDSFIYGLMDRGHVFEKTSLALDVHKV
jgi:SulP family sulfate permease